MGIINHEVTVIKKGAKISNTDDNDVFEHTGGEGRRCTSHGWAAGGTRRK